MFDMTRSIAMIGIPGRRNPMRPPMRALLHQIVDYAGLFPPAKLPLDTALTNYLRDRKSSPHRGMLGRFVCPTTQLKELAALAKAHPDASFMQVAAIGQQGARPGDLIERLRADIELIKDFRAGWNADTVLDSVELALPKGATIALLRSQLAFVPEELGELGMTGFIEVPMSASWTNDVAALCDVLHDMQHTQPDGIVGMKLRCVPERYAVRTVYRVCLGGTSTVESDRGLAPPAPLLGRSAASVASRLSQRRHRWPARASASAQRNGSRRYPGRLSW
jgi:hypothetical protein